jgi:prephenate dehydratase
MGLGQCRNFLRSRGIVAKTSSDTAGAAREVRDLGDPTQAAIAPRLAAEVYGLDILAENIEDAAHNTTRFVIMSRDAVQPEKAPGVTWVSAFVFRVRNVPAALYKTMGGFATNGVNMTKLESYQLGGSFNATQFYAEVEGHPDDPAVQRALEELGFFSTQVRHLGVFPGPPLPLDGAGRSRTPLTMTIRTRTVVALPMSQLGSGNRIRAFPSRMRVRRRFALKNQHFRAPQIIDKYS